MAEEAKAEEAKEGEQTKMAEPKKAAPIYKARYGNCSGAIWVNETPRGKSLSATFQKYYKAKDGSDKNTGNFFCE